MIAKSKVASKRMKTVGLMFAPLELQAIKQKAAKEGIPYRTWMANALHQYAEGLRAQSAN